MLDFIPCWECLENERVIGNGAPDQYVLFAVTMDIRSPFDDGCKSAIATIGQRDRSGRLYQARWYNRHFAPRKFTIKSKHSGVQIRLLHQLVTGLNDGTIDPESIPTKICNARAWDAIRTMLECSVGPIDA